MSVMAVALIGSVAVGAYSADQQRSAANRAARRQGAANDAGLAQQQQQFEASQALQMQIAGMANGTQRAIAGMQIAEVRRQFSAVQKVLSPFITAGTEALGPLKQYQNTGLDALGDQRDLIGMNGQGAQSAAIQGLSNSPEMAAYAQQGEASLMQNAAATGGLRGGNTQAALAQFRPSLLNSMISQQYDRLGGLTQLGANTSSMVYQTGQNAAAGQASAGMQAAGQIGSALSQYSAGVGATYGNLANASAANGAGMANAYGNYYNNQGAIGAGQAMAQGQAAAGFANTVSGALGSYSAMQMYKGAGMGSNPNTAALSGVSSFQQPSYNLASGYQGGGLGFRSGM
jgi:hypothetical protein